MDRDTDKRKLKQFMEEGKAYWGHFTADHEVARALFLMRESMRQHSKGAAVLMKASSTGVDDRNAETGNTASGCTCPRCKGSAYRVPRRWVDWLMSRIVWVSRYRYRCRSMGCGWEGNLRVRRRPLLIQGPW
ncbi:MAG: hypothetical protein GZ085_05915 [Sulfuriferula multivorans]|uniref:Uncharacterized protein n=1 Tax=Sulfuriferula multivorans TaxID=1559896 RepID=A0A7C9NTH8_9PROT|nr:hypothetical protein [Sulfuriferula multivorans]